MIYICQCRLVKHGRLRDLEKTISMGETKNNYRMLVRKCFFYTVSKTEA